MSSSWSDTTTHPIMSISSLLEQPSSSSSSSDQTTTTTTFMHQHPPLLPPMISPSSSSTSDDEMLLPPLDKSLFSPKSSSRSPSPDPRNSSIPNCLEERRKRNKIASAKYRAKRSQETKNMRQALEHLRRQNAVLLQALNDIYRDKSNIGAEQSSWSLSSSAVAKPPSDIHHTIHQQQHTYPMSF